MSERQIPWLGALAGAMGGIAGVFARTAKQILSRTDAIPRDSEARGSVFHC
jgi:hypothetical protein